MKDLTKIKTPFGLLGKKTQAALKAHVGPIEMLDEDGVWFVNLSPAFQRGATFRVKPHPQVEAPAEPATEYSTQAEIYAAVRVWLSVRQLDVPVISALDRVLALRIPS